jgi:hypothetical protein
MFKAIDRRDDAEIILADDVTDEDIPGLRLLDRQDILICQGCRQPVRIRAGDIRVWHFAHKNRELCPYGGESYSVLRARRVLYRRLKKEFGDKVEVEKQVAGVGLPHPVDCWIEGESGCIAYWILDAGIQKRRRDELIDMLAQAGAEDPNWVFTKEMLRQDPKRPNRIYLTVTERCLQKETALDKELHADECVIGRSLHYLDYDSEELITYRSLYQVHPPNGYQGRRYQSKLADVEVFHVRGRFAHPGEKERTRDLLPRIRRLQGTAGICIKCGARTYDYAWFDAVTKACKCRSCAERGDYRR